MKIVHICTTDTGGAGAACMRLHQALLLKGVKSEVLLLNRFRFDIQNVVEYKKAGKNKFSQFFELISNYLIENYLGYKIKGKPQGPEKFSFPISAYKIHDLKLIKEADVIHLHWCSYFIDFSSFFRNTLDKPIVWTIHDMNAFSGGYHYLEQFPVDSYIAEIQSNINIKTKALSFANIEIVSPSKWLEKISKSSSIFGKFKHHHVLNCLNKEIFKPRNKFFCRDTFGIPKDKIVLLFVSDNLNNVRKGFEILIKSIEELALNDEVLLLSIGTNGNFQNLKNTFIINGLRDELSLSIAYNAADFFVIPSIEDNSPNTVVEALCCGTPVVGFSIGGIKELIQENFNGILASKVDSNGLANAISLAIQSQTVFDREKISNDAQNKHSGEVIAQKHIEIYTEILKK
jgi:glycosyltransferase involved in cell wall biosynthesis